MTHSDELVRGPHNRRYYVAIVARSTKSPLVVSPYYEKSPQD